MCAWRIPGRGELNCEIEAIFVAIMTESFENMMTEIIYPTDLYDTIKINEKKKKTTKHITINL